MQIYFQFDDPVPKTVEYETLVCSVELSTGDWYVEGLGHLDDALPIVSAKDFSLKESNPDIETYNAIASDYSTLNPITRWSDKTKYTEFNDDQVLTYMYLSLQRPFGIEYTA